jgi:hypothetical protein
MSPAPADIVEFDPVSDLRHRVMNIETWRAQRDIADARAEEQRKYLDQRFTSLEKKINGVAWLIVSGFVLALVTFAFKGGLNLPFK